MYICIYVYIYVYKCVYICIYNDTNSYSKQVPSQKILITN